jgi:DNA polymerase III subunit beta
MRVTLQAKPLAAAMQQAASLVDSKFRIAALYHARLVAEGDGLSVATNVLDFALKLSLPAAVETAGEIAIPSEKLADLAAGFPGDADVTINGDEKIATIVCGRSRFRLPTLPIGDLPSTPEIADEIGRVELERKELLALLSRPLFAISTEETRFYLCGLCLHDVEDGLAAVATDGHRLARAIQRGASGLSHDRTLIIPQRAIKILLRLLKDAEGAIALSRSQSLLEVSAPNNFRFITKLIDAKYPAYERLISASTDHAVTVDRAALVQAVARIAAVAPDTTRQPLIGLTWKAPDPALHLCIPGAPDLADDPVEAETAGRGRVAVQIRHLAQLLDGFEADQVRIDTDNSAGATILITDPHDADFTIIQMPCVWSTEASQAAA